MQRVLFVDDELNVLDGFKRAFHSSRGQWDVHFAENGVVALALMQEKGAFDVVISDLQMPEMDGIALFREVSVQFPETIRFYLSGTAAVRVMMQASALSHQMLSKPCDVNYLRGAVTRALALRKHLANCTLKRSLLAMGTLPSLPALYREISEAMEAPTASAKTIGNIVERDVAMTVRILQVVNSAILGLPNRVNSVVQAVAILGLENLKHLILSMEVFPPEQTQTFPGGLSIEQLWQRSIKVGILAKRIAEAETQDQQAIQSAFTGGLLHEIGLVVLATRLESAFVEILEEVTRSGMSLVEAEAKTIGATHAALGGFLLELWGLPDRIVTAVTFHDRPGCLDSTQFSATTAVHAAGYLLAGGEHGTEQYALDSAHLDGAGVAGRVDAWKELAHDLY